jgi:hypothetical protein
MKIETVKLNCGLLALAKQSKHGLSAKTFANRTQAERAMAELQRVGIVCHIHHTGRPFYVGIDGAAAVPRTPAG